MNYLDAIEEATGSYRGPLSDNPWPLGGDSPIESQHELNETSTMLALGLVGKEGKLEDLLRVIVVHLGAGECVVGVGIPGDEPFDHEDEIKPLGSIDADLSAQIVVYAIRRALRYSFMKNQIADELAGQDVTVPSFVDEPAVKVGLHDGHAHYIFAFPGLESESLEVVVFDDTEELRYDDKLVAESFPAIEALTDSEIYQLIRWVRAWSRAHFNAEEAVSSKP